MSVETITKTKTRPKSRPLAKSKKKAFKEGPKPITLVEMLKRMPRENFIYETDNLEEEEYREWIWL